jgi:hypothetical protein
MHNKRTVLLFVTKEPSLCNMITLRLENINLHAPYRVMQDPNSLAIISIKDNPMLAMVIEEFNETISFLFDPLEEFT